MPHIRLTIGLGAVAMPLLALAASPIGAGLKGSPFERFTDADFEKFLVGARTAAVAPIGDVTEWSNTDSGAHGTVRAVRSYKYEDADCRELRGQNFAQGRTEPFRIGLCKDASGKWRLAPLESPAADPPAAKSPQSEPPRP